MPAFVRCPECSRRFRLPQSDTAEVYCPHCDARVELDEEEEIEEERRPSRRIRRSNTRTLLIAGLVVCGVLLVLCAGGVGLVVWLYKASSSFPGKTGDYAQARQHFHTKLLREGPAPQDWQNEHPPDGVREVPYQSGNLRLRAWVSGQPADGKRRPAVLFLHGGFAFGGEDWVQTLPFRNAGFVVMTPTLRGENGLPGAYSMFYNEVEDVLAATEELAQLPYVDSNRIYIAGHSVGGTLTMLAAMTSKRFRAAASFSGSPDQSVWARMQPQGMPFNAADPREFQMRSPIAFPTSLKCPLRIYYGSQEPFFAADSQRIAHLAKAAGLDVEAQTVPGDHFTMVDPAIQLAVAFFRQK